MPSKPPNQDTDLRVDPLADAARDALDRVSVWRRSRLGLRGVLIYILATPLAPATIVSLAKGNTAGAFAAGIALGLISMGAFLNRQGLSEELISQKRRFTRSWRLPLRYVAALSVAAGTAIAAYGAVDQSAWISAAFGALTIVGFHLAYRLPKLEAVLGARRVAVGDKTLQKALAKAELRILAIEDAASTIGNRELEQRLQRIASQGRGLLDQLVARPDERFRVRKFLNVYLEGAERVASRYVKTHRLARDQELEQNFRNVLVDIEQVFRRQLNRQAKHDVFDLDVQIDVLRKQLEHEGII